MAFISELNFLGGGAGEFIEITLAPGDDPADFTVSAYNQNGNLYPASGIPTGEVVLSTLTGIPHPDNPAYTIYQIPVGIRNAVSDSNEGSAIALTDTSSGGGVVSFVSADSLSPITVSNGAAAGAQSDDILNHTLLTSGQSYQWDIAGNLTLGPITVGTSILCLTGGAEVKTDRGLVVCDTLAIGDQVWTADHGFQTIRWIGKSAMTPSNFAKNPKMKPVRIAANALGAGVPCADLLVSPQHRVLVRSVVAERMYDTKEVLVSARMLTEMDGIDEVTPDQDITYVHILCDHHEILDANGTEVESLLLAEESTSALESRRFVGPNRLPLSDDLRDLATQPCRVLAKGRKARNLVARLKANMKPIQPADKPELARAAK